jgi:metal-responsive CopG/Arc/MetJ family transcriptional regulator
MKIIKFNVNLPEDLHKRFKLACVLEGKDMTEIVRTCIQKYVEKAEKKLKK